MDTLPPYSLCEINGRFSSCKNPADARCIYCGRPFCQRHGIIEAEGHEVCNRKFCVAKREDLMVHMAYKDVVLARNDQKQCGIDGCHGELESQCIRCRGFFCVLHVEGREEKIQENQVFVVQIASLCRHCFVRRPIWLRV